MSNSSLMRKDFKIVSSFKRLVSKEMNLIKVFRVDVFETVRFIPSRREAIKGDLATNAVRQIQIGKFLPHRLYHVLSDIVFQIKLFVIVTFFPGTVSTDRRDIEHARSEFNKRAALIVADARKQGLERNGTVYSERTQNKQTSNKGLP